MLSNQNQNKSSQANHLASSMVKGFEDPSANLTQLVEVLKPALAVTVFLHLAKQHMNIPIYAPQVEEMIQNNTKKAAIERGVEPKPVKQFIQVYCDLSKDIQTHWKDNGVPDNYELSEVEKTALEEIKTLEGFAEVQNLKDVKTRIEEASEDNKNATAILSWGRQKIGAGNTQLYNIIAANVKMSGFGSTNDIESQLQTAVEAVFSKQIQLENNRISDWANALNDCKMAEENVIEPLTKKQKTT